MKIDINQVISWQNLSSLEGIKQRLQANPELVVFHEDKAQMVILSLDRYATLTQPAPQRAVSTMAEEPPLGIGAYVRKTMKRLLENNVLTPREIAELGNAEYCQNVLRNTFVVLKPLVPGRTLLEQRRDARGYGRYYNEVFQANGQSYILTNNWTENTHRKAFEAWLGGR